MKNTIEAIKAHAKELILRGAPFTKDELTIIKSGTPQKDAFNSGKRNNKHFQQTGK